MCIVNGLHDISGSTWTPDHLHGALTLLVTLWVLADLAVYQWVGEHLIRSPDAHCRRSRMGADQDGSIQRTGRLSSVGKAAWPTELGVVADQQLQCACLYQKT